MAAKTPMMATTIRSSIRVKPREPVARDLLKLSDTSGFVLLGVGSGNGFFASDIGTTPFLGLGFLPLNKAEAMPSAVRKVTH